MERAPPVLLINSESKRQFLHSIGCNHVINYKTENVREQLKTYPKGIDIVFESVGGQMFRDALKSLAVRGRMVVIGAVSTYAKTSSADKMKTFSEWDDTVQTASLLNRSTTVSGFFLNHYAKHFPVHLNSLIGMVDGGKLVCHTHALDGGLESIPRAISALYSGKCQGKVIVDMNVDQRRPKL